jgi:hypothetical protein
MAESTSKAGLQVINMESTMKTNLLLIVVWLVAIASCIAVSQQPADCALVKTTWMSKVMIGCPER